MFSTPWLSQHGGIGPTLPSRGRRAKNTIHSLRFKYTDSPVNEPLVRYLHSGHFLASNKRGISALRIAKHLGVSWITAQNMLRKIRKAMADRDSVYRLENMIEFDDTLVGGKRAGKRGRGAEGKRPVLVAVETREKGVGFAAMHTVDSVSKVTVRQFFAKHLKAGQIVKTDALPGLNAVDETQDHRERVTPPEEAAVWLPLVHTMIGNMKTFIIGTFHGVPSNCLQEYLDEFCYRFNRRFWEPELPLRFAQCMPRSCANKDC